MKTLSFIFIAASLFTACQKKQNPYDASGTFEAVETIVPANAAGIIEQFNIAEGQVIDSGQLIGYIDSIQLYLRKKQLQAQIQAVLSKKPNIAKQIAAYQEQLRQAEHEQQRIERLVKADAATPKQLDDANSLVAVINKQIEALQSTLVITSTGLTEDAGPLYTQIDQLNDQLNKCKIINPVRGTVLTTYAEAHEMAAPGKALYKVADLSTILLRAYITGDQLTGRKLGDQVTVLVDDEGGRYKEYTGKIEWISDKAEFTPKTIQTKDERANLVYAMKIRVQNDGFLKIGMYGEVKF
jgi:HlyD family secretion protein